ncbi:MAG: hypothetical protein KGH53_02695 [Candidatus Micrarchaeota archaeon]|nr:hypothetical protein [Candidatus Micrarchaeota archaeon]
MMKILAKAPVPSYPLFMSLPLQATLKVPTSKLVSLLKNYPLLKPLSYGTQPSYLAKTECADFVFEFGPKSIVEKIYSPLSPVYSMRQALLRLLSIISFLGDSYEVKPQSILPYLISELSRPEMNSILKSAPAPRNGNPEILLSKRIIELLSSLENSVSKNKRLNSRASSLIAHLLLRESEKGEIVLKDFFEKYSVDQSLLDGASKELFALGFRPVMQNGKRLLLVRL